MARYRLLLTFRSPFARRVRLALRRIGVDFAMQEVDPFLPSPEFLAASPLGLVPVLVTPEGQPVPDSQLILDALEDRHGGVWPRDARARFEARRIATLCCGALSAAVGHLLETRRPADAASLEWREDYRSVLRRTLALLESERAWETPHPQALTDLGVLLEYLDFRIPDLRRRELAPGLARAIDRCEREIPDFADTRPVGG